MLSVSKRFISNQLSFSEENLKDLFYLLVTKALATKVKRMHII